jgi:hypothetical protein
MDDIGRERQTIQQTWDSVSIIVPATPQAISLASVAQSAGVLLVDSIIIGLHPDAASIIYLGKAGVIGGLTSNGIPILEGEKIQLSISNERPIYEIQAPIVDQTCSSPVPIPLVVWNLSDMWLTADGQVTAVVQFFHVAWR